MSTIVKCDRCGYDIPLSDQGSFMVETKYTKGDVAFGSAFKGAWDLCKKCRTHLTTALNQLVPDLLLKAPDSVVSGRVGNIQLRWNPIASPALVEVECDGGCAHAKEWAAEEQPPFPSGMRLFTVEVRDVESGEWSLSRFYSRVEEGMTSKSVKALMSEAAKNVVPEMTVKWPSKGEKLVTNLQNLVKVIEKAGGKLVSPSGG